MKGPIADGLISLAVRIDRILLAGIGYNAFAKRRIEKDTSDRDNIAGTLIEDQQDVAQAIAGDELTRFEEEERERLRSLEDKGRTNLLGITLAFALLSTGVTLVGGGAQQFPDDGSIRTLVMLSVAAAGFYFIVGGLHALGALGIGVRYRITPDDYLENKELDRKATRLFYLHQNQRMSLLRSNALSVSFSSIRNGVLALAGGIFVIILNSWLM